MTCVEEVIKWVDLYLSIIEYILSGCLPHLHIIGHTLSIFFTHLHLSLASNLVLWQWSVRQLPTPQFRQNLPVPPYTGSKLAQICSHQPPPTHTRGQVLPRGKTCPEWIVMTVLSLNWQTMIIRGVALPDGLGLFVQLVVLGSTGTYYWLFMA